MDEWDICGCCGEKSRGHENAVGNVGVRAWEIYMELIVINPEAG